MHRRASLLIPSTLASFVLACPLVACASDDHTRTDTDTETETRIETEVRTVEVRADGDDVQVFVDGAPTADAMVIERGKRVFVIDGADAAVDLDRMVVARRGEMDRNEEDRPMLGIAMAKADRGVAIVEVLEGTPAEAAGLKRGDVIIGSGDAVLDPEALSRRMGEFKVGQVIGMKVLRDGEIIEKQVRLAPRDARMNPDDAEGPGLEAILDLLRTEVPGLFGEGETDIDVMESDGRIEVQVMHSSDEHGDLEGRELSAMILRMIEEIMEDGGEHHEEHWDEEHWDEEHWDEEHWDREHRDEEHWDREHRDEEHWDREHQGEEHWEERHHSELGELEHHIEGMLEEAWIDMMGWARDMGSGIEEFAHDVDQRFEEFARDVDHRFEEFAQMFGDRMRGMEEGVDHRFHDAQIMHEDINQQVGEMFERHNRELERAFRDRDEQLRRAGEDLQRGLDEAGREIRDALRRLGDSQARLAERNRMLEERIRRLEEAMRGDRGRDARRDRTRDRDVDRDAARDRRGGEERNRRRDRGRNREGGDGPGRNA